MCFSEIEIEVEEQAEYVFQSTNVCGCCCSADGQLNKLFLPKNISVWFVLLGPGTILRPAPSKKNMFWHLWHKLYLFYFLWYE